MKALIVDTEELFRLSLREVISITKPFHEIIEAGSEHEFLSVTAANDTVDLVVISPHQLSTDSTQWVHLVKRLYPKAAVVVFFQKNNPSICRARENGVEMLPRDSSVSQTVTTIRRALKMPNDTMGQSFRKPDSANMRENLRQMQDDFDHSGLEPLEISRLSFRQKQILSMAADGLPNKEIAARLSIAEGTVKAHMHSIFKVMGVSNRTQAVIRYSSLGAPNSPAMQASAAY